MPAIDNLFGNGAIHITDRNKKNPIITLCGQALDKDTIRFFEDITNFDQATCKVCRKSFFDENWSGSRSDNTQNLTQEHIEDENSSKDHQTLIEPEQRRTTLFSSLKAPVNVHPIREEKPNGD